MPKSLAKCLINKFINASQFAKISQPHRLSLNHFTIFDRKHPNLIKLKHPNMINRKHPNMIKMKQPYQTKLKHLNLIKLNIII